MKYATIKCDGNSVSSFRFPGIGYFLRIPYWTQLSHVTIVKGQMKRKSVESDAVTTLWLTTERACYYTETRTHYYTQLQITCFFVVDWQTWCQLSFTTTILYYKPHILERYCIRIPPTAAQSHKSTMLHISHVKACLLAAPYAELKICRKGYISVPIKSPHAKLLFIFVAIFRPCIWTYWCYPRPSSCTCVQWAIRFAPWSSFSMAGTCFSGSPPAQFAVQHSWFASSFSWSWL